MSVTFRTRARVAIVAVAFFLAGVSVAALTGIPSALAVSVVLVAATTWAFGWRWGLVAVVFTKVVEFILFHTGTLSVGVPAAVILVPVLFTDGVVIVAVAALRRAEQRQTVIEAELREKNAELEATLAEVKELRGMLPICAWCKCVRDVGGMWNQLETYLAKHSRATLTHGICPKCLAQMEAEMQSLPPTG